MALKSVNGGKSGNNIVIFYKYQKAHDFYQRVINAFKIINVCFLLLYRVYSTILFFLLRRLFCRFEEIRPINYINIQYLESQKMAMHQCF